MSRVAPAALLALGLLAGCASVPRPAELSPAQRAQAQAAQQARETALRARPAWTLEGRIAVSAGGKGGSGRIDWTQDGTGYEIALSAPVTRQSWRLTGDTATGVGRLEGLEGGPRTGPDAQALLREATGWTIPVGLLPHWVRGMAAQGAQPPEHVDYGADGQLLRLHQAGWAIEYPEWFPARDGALPMPRRIVARQGDATVRLVVDGWQDARPDPAASADPGGLAQVSVFPLRRAR